MSLSGRLLSAALPRFDGHWVSVENSLHALEGDSPISPRYIASCIVHPYNPGCQQICVTLEGFVGAMELYFMVGCSITN